MSNQERTSPASAGAPRVKRYAAWPESQQGLPEREPTVRIIFHGLLCLFFDGSSMCYVGTHNTTAADDHPHPHRYVINVWRTVGGVCHQHVPPQDIGNPNSKPRLDIAATNPALLDGTYVYTRDPFTRPDPDNENDPNDWRWVIDFDELYPDGVDIDPATLEPGVTIDNGLFYTLRTTCTKFLLRADDNSGSPDIELGSVAHYVAANIYLRPDDGVVTLSGGPFDSPLPLRAEPGVTYQIDITNNCNKGHDGCKFDSDPAKPKDKRNDFFLYYDVLDPGDEPEYELIRSKPCPALPDIDEEFRQISVCPSPRVRSTDDAPCGVVGFGQTPVP